MHFNTFFNSYLQCLGFTAHQYIESDQNNDPPLFECVGPFNDSVDVWDELQSILDIDDLQALAVDAWDFYQQAPDVVKDDADLAEQAGVDFHFTRNGHGAGFWDGDWAEPHATQLTDLSNTYGTLELEGERNADGDIKLIQLIG